MIVPTIVTGPAAEPVTLEEARLHCRVDAEGSPAQHPDDPLLDAFITTAREWAEKFTGLSLAPQTLEIALDAFPSGAIELPRGPVTSITSISYVDEEQADQTVDAGDYTLDARSVPQWAIPAYGGGWPAALDTPNAVVVRYVAGFSLPSDSPQTKPLPKTIKTAILQCVAHWYANREMSSIRRLETIPLGAEVLLRSYRVEKALA